MAVVRSIWYICGVILIAGCSLTAKLFDAPQLTPGYHVLLLDSGMGQVNLYQEVDLLTQDFTAQFHLATTLNSEHITLIGLNSIGQRLFDVSYDGLGVSATYQGAKLHQYNEKQLVRDIQWIFWPLRVIRDSKTNSNWRFVDAAQTRLIYFENQHVASVREVVGGLWSGEYVYNNHIDQYELHVKSIRYE